MNEHLDIFNDIYAIKDKISDNDFLELNNKLQKLIQENNQLKEKKKGQRRRRMILIPSRSNNRILPGISREFIIENDDEENINSQEDEQIIEIEEERGCRCREIWSYQSYMDHDVDLSKCFCFGSDESLRECENFILLVQELPLLENLFEKKDIPFIEEPINSEYNKNDIVRVSKVLLEIIENIRGTKRKSIIAFIMYDYYIRNIRFLIDYPRFAKATYNKLELLIREEPTFITYAQEYNVNYKKWQEIFKSIVDSHEQQTQ